MKKTRSRDSRLTLRRETLQRLDERQLRAAGGDVFTDACSLMPSHDPCSMPCSFSCLPEY